MRKRQRKKNFKKAMRQFTKWQAEIIQLNIEHTRFSYNLGMPYYITTPMRVDTMRVNMGDVLG